jgi:hypothetical protein
MSTSFYNVAMHDGQKTLSSTMAFSDELLTPGKCLRQFTQSTMSTKFNRWVHQSEATLCEGDGKTVRVSFSKLIEFCLNPQLVIFRSKHIARLRAFGCALERMRRLGTLPDTDETIHIHVPQCEQDVAESERFASMNIFEYKHQVLPSDKPQSCASSSSKFSSSFISSGSGTLSEGSSSSSTSSSSGLSVASDGNIVHVECDDRCSVKRSKRTRTSIGCDQDGESPRMKKRASLNEGTHASRADVVQTQATLTLAEELQRYAYGMLYVLNIGTTARIPSTYNGIADSMLNLLAYWGQDYRQCPHPFLTALQTFGSPSMLNETHNPHGSSCGGDIAFRALPDDWDQRWREYSVAYRMHHQATE